MSNKLNHLKRKFNKMILDDSFVTPRRESSNLRVIQEQSRQHRQQSQQKKKNQKDIISNQTTIQNQYASKSQNSTTANMQLQQTSLRNKKRDLETANSTSIYSTDQLDEIFRKQEELLMDKIANGDYPRDYDLSAELLELKRTHEEFVSFYFEQLIPKVGMLLF